MNCHLGFHLIGLSSTSHLQAMPKLVQEPTRRPHLDLDPWSSLNGCHLVEGELVQSRGELPRLRPSCWRFAEMTFCYLVPQ